ncbi:hypothetical protein K491DRAFT_721881 [Lophiostoma macrostomum CBS 122681]|uniref:Uncharacterized protein n=1 Tax=Lophiostoma macrostomum CBS 122681 TaxID=1314788 RepID=A0A6A6SQD9_9PLEO|nr:hypothetical protein K491DRAFT_721881 [Lophiostoma macrostomum CBS 122681]
MTKTETPDLGKVWDPNPSSPFDPYNNSNFSTTPSSMDRIKKRTKDRSQELSTPGVDSSPYLGSGESRFGSHLQPPIHDSEMPSRKGSCATNRSLMSEAPDMWEEQATGDASQGETPETQPPPAISRSRSFMDRFISKPKPDNHSPTSHLRVDYAGKWHARRMSGETRSLYNSPSVPEEDEEFEFVAPNLKDSPKEILARVASRESSISIPTPGGRAEALLSSSPMIDTEPGATIGKTAGKVIVAKLGREDIQSRPSRKTGTNTVKAKASTLSLKTPMELFSISPKASLSIATPVTMHSQEPVPPMSAPSTSPGTTTSRESASSKSSSSVKTPATVHSQIPTPPSHKAIPDSRKPTLSPKKKVRRQPEDRTPSSPSPNTTTSKAFSPLPAKTLKKRPSTLSTQSKKTILKPSPSQSINPPKKRSRQTINRGLSLSGAANIVLTAGLAAVVTYIIENAGEVFVESLLRKMGIAFLAGIALCLVIRVFQRRLLKIPEDLAYAFGKAAGPVVKAAVMGLKEGYAVEE